MTIKQKVGAITLAVMMLAPLTAFAKPDSSGKHLPKASEILGTDQTAGFEAQVTEFSGTANATNVSLIGAIRTVVNAFLAIVALVAVIVIILAGFRYVTSGGDEEAAATAKNQILYALIGLVIILLSAIIVNFVISLFTVIPVGST